MDNEEQLLTKLTATLGRILPRASRNAVAV
jgi:hypothetical protein